MSRIPFVNVPRVTLTPDTPGRKIGERIALLIAAGKFLNEIPVKRDTEENGKCQ